MPNESARIHVVHFAELTQQALEDMFGCEAKIDRQQLKSATDHYMTEMPFSVRIQFTGLVDQTLISGEYILATDERVAAAACDMVSASATSCEVDACRDHYCNGFSELLNGVVGEAVLAHETLGRMRCTTPRISFGRMSYGRLKISMVTLTVGAGRIECLFLCDRSAL